MRHDLAHVPWLDHESTAAVIAALARGGAAACFVGGCVRDGLLDVTPADIDLATPATPEMVARLGEAAGLRVVPTGLAHGTVTVVSAGQTIEVTTLRRDLETDGRHATVAFTDDWTIDAARRDFTINALYAEPDGRVIDVVGGLADLAAGRVRFIGEATARIAEDYLRILRFFRFYGRFSRLDPDSEAVAAIVANLDGIGRLSAERVRTEILKSLVLPRAVEVLALMVETGVLGACLPEVRWRPVDLARLIALEAEWRGSLGAGGPWRRLLLILDGDAALVATAAARLKLANAERDRLLVVAEVFHRLTVARDEIAVGALLHRWGAGAVGDAALLGASRGAAESMGWREVLARAGSWQPMGFPLKGADLVARGLAPGRAVGCLLGVLESWWLAGGMAATRDQCLEELERRLDFA